MFDCCVLLISIFSLQEYRDGMREVLTTMEEPRDFVLDAVLPGVNCRLSSLEARLQTQDSRLLELKMAVEKTGRETVMSLERAFVLQ